MADSLSPATSFRPTCVLLAATLLVGIGCTPRKFVADQLADALSSQGASFASDEDPQLVREALPFSLKLMESVLEQTPSHAGLLTETSSAFTQYAYAFLVQDADELETRDIAAAMALRDRARGLFLRGRDYGLRGLEVSHRGFSQAMEKDPLEAVKVTTKEDVPLLYWTAAGWGAAIAISKSDPAMVADQIRVQALIDRAVQLDETWDNGVLHTFLISYEPARQGATRPVEERCRADFARAVELSKGQMAAPYLAMAEAVPLQKQDKAEFESLLKMALAIDVDKNPSRRLANLVMQKRARWLLSRTGDLFVE